MTCRFRVAPMLAVVGLLSACENPLGPMVALDLDLTVQADGFVPGQAVPYTIVLRNPTVRPIDLTSCAIGVEGILPNGEVIEGLRPGWAQPLDGGPLVGVPFRTCADQTTILPWDSLIYRGNWYAYPAGPVDLAGWSSNDSTGEFPLGLYHLRPYLAVREGTHVGDAVPIPMLPWTRAQFMHSFIGLPAVDIVVAGRPAASDLEPGGLSPEVAVAAGPQKVEIRQEGLRISTTWVTLSERILHTIVLRAGPDGPEAWDVTDTTGHPGPGESALRVIHLAAGAPGIDVYGVQPDHRNPTRIISGDYGARSPYVLGDSGRWTVVVTTTGGRDTLLVAPLAIKGGEVRTMLLIDDGQGGIAGPLIEP
jgi:Domain of unknown function (DUF4397)